MYIQPTPEETNVERHIPQGYSGTAFSAEPMTVTSEDSIAEEPPQSEAPDARNAASLPQDDTTEQSEDSVPAFGPKQGTRSEIFGKKTLGSLFSDLPFLSALLPPPRGHHKEHSDLFQWILIGGAVLLFLNDATDDILPLLLLLLLWD